MRAIVALAQKIGPTDVPVLIAGETGAGKEVVAELIHANSNRTSRKMVCVNCAGLPADLIESELFGSTRGSFTGSLDRTGIFKHANFSTIFLDELSEMPLHLQSKLLRFMQDKRVRRVGSVGDEPVDVRVIAAVNKDPRACVKENRLREDLYYRLSTVTVLVPPLRDRPLDILPLAHAYLNFFSEQYKHAPPVMEPNVIEMLGGYEWPGNVRQLINEMNRCALLCNGKVSLSDLTIQQDMLNDADEDDLQNWMTVPVSSLSELERAEAKAVVRCLIVNKFNQVVSSQKLGIGRQTLYAKIKLWGIKTPATDARVAERILLHTESAEPKDAPAPLPPSAPRAPRKSAQSSASSDEASGGLWEGGFLD